ncbi:DUF4345 domain-containing protein [Cecembia rubra]|uniref:Uncharacterized protein DUF4345 n=1 Tax=Cecembia rubra TaxID=1485585 RepID=A0A2P8EE25_9BACT|nr:DUF4345 domain-containing protein [Cecembia rubra]PSL07721.1 uncharacterized protein DUF4345 [Cecembia rubra]
MKSNKIFERTTKVYVIFSLLSLLYVSIMALFSPQQVMDMVQVNLNNTDAISSIRGVYGGVGISISSMLIFLLFKKHEWAFGFLVMFWGSYAISRVLTILLEGNLGDFGSNWLMIESFLFIVGAGILLAKNIFTKTDELIYTMIDQNRLS